jgi:hypothetical protein
MEISKHFTPAVLEIEMFKVVFPQGTLAPGFCRNYQGRNGIPGNKRNVRQTLPGRNEPITSKGESSSRPGVFITCVNALIAAR